MNIRGNLIEAMATLPNGHKYPIFQWAKLSKDQYLIIIDKTFAKDPIRQKYSIVSKKRFLKLIEINP